MKTICHALFALSALLIASCSKQTSDIIEWSTNGVTGVRMPLHVTFVENVQVEESAMQDAISITPAVGFDAYLSGMRMIRIVPKSPLQYDTQYKVPSTPRNSPAGSTRASRSSGLRPPNCGLPTTTTGCSRTTR